MAKTKIINKRGEVVDLDLDDSSILPDGYGIRTPMFLLDAVQQEIASSSRVTDATNFQVTDAFGRKAGHRPGHVFARDDNEAEARARAAYNAHREYLKDAWRNPGAAVSDQTPEDPQVARERYKQKLSNAWRTPSGVRFGPGSFGAGD